ncbi:P-loop containing nucleoside triphosphate hydrolase protein [Terfezia boudieri ATCC MYA-4762]|uniref:P-loop containing nucleoside triphosphate hydrolase protein n=1 Tax=Terfezia boudieri ATCC MYA-4762 TaxID=1051890 RepID=A0A3N4LSW1_9PEZI|nr:P-loop containing nucleoside triphosphate hydrolase protein [Terfezia boudieri ATCC MYA-4762]
MPPRKRKAAEDVNVKEVDSGAETKRKGKGKRADLQVKKTKSKEIKEGEEESTPVPTAAPLPWPQHFKRLSQTHSALNLVYTFCCTRKHLATTFETIKAAVEGRIRRELSVDEVVEVKCLVGPRGIRLEWTNCSEEEEWDDDKGKAKGGMALLFEYVDGADGGRKKTKSGATLEMTQAQMMKVINRRNERFTNAVNGFLEKCAKEGVQDPVEVFRKGCAAHMPVSPYLSEESSSTPASPESTIPPEIPIERKSITEILGEIKHTREFYHDQIVPGGHFTIPARGPNFGDLTFLLSQGLVNALYNARGITRLYSHQAAALNAIHGGEDVIVSTSTSSGKSLIYQLPVLHAIERDRRTKAMYIFPTKALAQDQLRGLKDLLSWMGEGGTPLEGIEVGTFDGDMGPEERREVRERATVVFTNPDMLHVAVLPNEGLWRSFLRELKFVVVDELHVYNNQFGAHMAFIMRRLRRICAIVGNEDIRFISCSATVANPEEHMKTIFGLAEVTHISIDGSPSGTKQFLCWDPPLKDPTHNPIGPRTDIITESAHLLMHLILRGVRTIAFARVRKSAELLLTALRTELIRLGRPEAADRVMAYRGGYTPQDRRQIENDMFQGKLLCIIATTALELGVDIGSLDAVVMVGFPFSVAGMRQQSGRAGRRNRDSLAVLMGSGAPMDRYYMNKPGELMSAPNASVEVDIWGDEGVAEGHLQCAALESPIHPGRDERFFAPPQGLRKFCEERLQKGDPDPSPGIERHHYYHPHQRFLPQPARRMAMRDTDDKNKISIVDVTSHRNKILEELEPARASFTLYTGAVYLHQGRTYLVRHLDIDNYIARVERVSVNYITIPRDHTEVWPYRTDASRVLTLPPPHTNNSKPTTITVSNGAIRLSTVIYGYNRVPPPPSRPHILESIDTSTVELPHRFVSGTWLDLPPYLPDLLTSHGIDALAAVHAAEHAIQGALLPGKVRVKCRVKLGGGAEMIFWDSAGGEGGMGWRVFEDVEGWIGKGLEKVERCGCAGEDGCEKCIGAVGGGWPLGSGQKEIGRCYEGDQGVSKKGAEIVLSVLRGREVEWGSRDLEFVGEVLEGSVKNAAA